VKQSTVTGLETLKQFVESNAREGHYPNTEWSLRGLYRHRKALGLEDAFVKIGRRVLVKRAVFYDRLAKGKKGPNRR
jgi:hypothetical protein